MPLRCALLKPAPRPLVEGTYIGANPLRVIRAERMGGTLIVFDPTVPSDGFPRFAIDPQFIVDLYGPLEEDAP